jgi:hypothetical protein
VIFLTGEGPVPSPATSSTRHVARGADPEESLPDARPERRPDTPEAEPPMAKKKKNAKRPAPPARDEGEARADAAAAEEEDAPGEEAAAPVVVSAAASSSGRAEEPEPEAEDPEGNEAPAPETKGAKGAEAKGAEAKGAEAKGAAAKGAAAKGAAAEGKTPVAPPGPAKPLEALGWAAAVLVLNLGILAFLAYLPPLGCPPGQTSCGWGTGCVQLSASAAHCGACGHACAASERCRLGTCQALDAE